MGKPLKVTIGESIKAFRTVRNRSQEGLGPSQSYISMLENGGTWNVTLLKIDQIGEALDVHPLSILTAAYRSANPDVSLQDLLQRIEKELTEIDV